MADQNQVVEEKKKKSGGCLIILFVMLLTPLLVIGALYAFNKDFKLSVNSIMSNVPGAVGNYFENFPTREEEQAQIRVISDYMLNIDESRAVDKLMVLMSEDQNAYNDVIKDMLRINPNKTKSILDAIRNSTMTSDVLTSTVDQISQEKTTDLQAVADYWTSLPKTSALDEINTMIEGSINGYKSVAEVIELMDPAVAEAILYQMSTDDLNRIFANLSDAQTLAIKEAHMDMVRQQNELEQLASVYTSEDPNVLIQSIGDTRTYNIEELAIIYKAMGAKKAGEVLAKSPDDTFVLQVIEKMKENEILENGSDNLTADVLKSLKVYKEFDDNVSELVNVYTKMDTGKVAEMIKNMIINASPSRVYDLSNGDFITISDEKLALDILNSFTQTQKADILSQLDNTLSTELTRMLALPQN